MTDWIPRSIGEQGPRYVALVDELESDIAAGRIAPGTRLLPQREMAERLGLSVGTVSKAYAEAGQRGLISGEVGRGTFVLSRETATDAGANYGAAARASVNFALNIPPSTGEAAIIAKVLSEIATEVATREFLDYRPHQGLRRHRDAAVKWIGDHGLQADPDLTFITHGAQHAISMALGMVVPPGGVVLAEDLTYSGIFALASERRYRLEGVALDQFGIVPKALDDAFAATGAKALYAMPSLQTPTARTMPQERREEIVEVLRRHDAAIIEDDAYAFLFETPPKPIAAIAPERSFYVVSFAKCLAPGLRIGALVAPEPFRDRVINAMRATSWMASPIMAEVVAQLIQSGALAEQARRKRTCAQRRMDLVRNMLKNWVSSDGQPSFHIWLPLAQGRTVSGLITQASQAGIAIAPPHALRPHDEIARGVRLCLGAPKNEKELEEAVCVVRNILQNPEPMSVV